MRSNETIIFSLYGALFDEAQYGFSLKSLCGMLSCLGFSEDASRLALSRMAREGNLYTKKKGKNSFYFLSDAGLQRIHRAENRSLFRKADTVWDGRFYMISYEFPETLRDTRNTLAQALKCAGFGRAANGLWASAYKPESDLEDYLKSTEIKPYIDEYIAEHVSDTKAFANRIWKLSENKKVLENFISEYTKAKNHFLQVQGTEHALSPTECFNQYFEALSDFVDAMASVPRVPQELLGIDWPSSKVSELFTSYRSLVRNGAEIFYKSVYEAY